MSKNLSVADVLERAADRIAPKGRWCQHSEAMNARGEPVSGDDPTAVKWCATGAINLECGITGGRIAADHPLFEPSREAFREVAGQRPMPFNDGLGRKQSEVVAKLREAALRARASQEQPDDRPYLGCALLSPVAVAIFLM